MADAVTLERVAKRLRAAAAALPAGAGFWEALSVVAADEVTRVITISPQPLPTNAFLVTAPAFAGEALHTLHVLGRGDTLGAALLVTNDLLAREGVGEAWIVEIKRIQKVST